MGGVRPLCIDLFCGLGGWTEGFLAEGYRVVGFDIEVRPYPAQLVIQDVLTIHGSQFKDAAVIVASPPCQNYSYLAMPWSRSVDWARPDGDGWEVLNSAAAKEMRQKWEREGPDNRLFDACFRIQREAIEATSKWCCGGPDFQYNPDCPKCHGRGFTTRYIPLVIENVRGAIPWVGRSAWNFGSFHLWGDVPALMPIRAAFKGGGGSWFAVANNTNGHSKNPVHELTKSGLNGNRRNDAGDDESRSPVGSDGIGDEHSGAQEDGGILAGMGAKGRAGGGWFGDGKNGATRKSGPRDVRKQADGSWMTPDGTKVGGDWFRDPACHSEHGSRSSARKAASAEIAKIPLPLSQHIAAVYYPRTNRKGATAVATPQAETDCRMRVSD